MCGPCLTLSHSDFVKRRTEGVVRIKNGWYWSHLIISFDGYVPALLCRLGEGEVVLEK